MLRLPGQPYGYYIIYLQPDIVVNILARNWKISHLVFQSHKPTRPFFDFLYSERGSVSRVWSDLGWTW